MDEHETIRSMMVKEALEIARAEAKLRVALEIVSSVHEDLSSPRDCFKLDGEPCRSIRDSLEKLLLDIKESVRNADPYEFRSE